ncbi:dTDP-4-dehydrorhamnose 3,5-epimerase [Waterburya agarophytonicola K14]|uniref:dTDP-4-dehydrorhamnose 3,5-epimerase n=1 Tax=Waterburya agarophytonicola KI4 TaxID=2874699 RepID=A0A964BNP0_9CYAN|nr:dTDP-4-dehydrorhamnose 3,5-epimerase [Waterburya agarophytonicola]MCC0176764.1 dTDP-4-dehydrorhamnose 3,5-epimerase [Waterburya agarophytonicola KI4]
MLFTPTKLKDAYIVEPKKLEDERGFFARSWCETEFRDRGLNPNLVQCNISFNQKKGTLRGMHLQIEPYAEAKLVRCTQGAIYDVIVDLRPDSETYLQWVGVELTPANHKALYVPEGFAHGFQTLADNTEVFYQMSQFYTPECARGYRWNDPSFDISWSEEISVISEKDLNLADYVAPTGKG